MIDEVLDLSKIFFLFSLSVSKKKCSMRVDRDSRIRLHSVFGQWKAPHAQTIADRGGGEALRSSLLRQYVPLSKNFT